MYQPLLCQSFEVRSLGPMSSLAVRMVYFVYFSLLFVLNKTLYSYLAHKHVTVE